MLHCDKYAEICLLYVEMTLLYYELLVLVSMMGLVIEYIVWYSSKYKIISFFIINI